MSHTGNRQPEISAEEHDHTARAKRVVQLAYNPGEGSAQPITMLDAALTKFDADDTAPIYIGVNADADAIDGATDWTVFKFTYSGGATTVIRRKVGSWTGRAALFS